MIDIVFVIPPSPMLLNPLMYYPLGVLYLAAESRRRGFSVAIEDLRDYSKRQMLNWTPDYNARIYAFTATSGEADNVKILAGKVRHPTRVIVGGPHATLSPEDYDGHFATMVRGEGEKAIGQILVGRQGILTTKRIQDLDSIAFPAWDLLPYDRCFSKTLFPGERYGEQEERAATIICSRGCPFHCAFCGNMLSRQVVYRSGANIAEELKILRDVYKIKHFRFEDDNLTLNKQWLQEICSAIEPLGIKFKCHTRADLLTSTEAKLLYAAGCRELGIGLETADDRILEKVQKGITSDAAACAVECLRQAGIRSKVYLMTGLPGETWKSIDITKNWVLQNKPDKWTLSRFAPYPGTKIYNEPELYGVEFNGHYDSENLCNFAPESAYTLQGVKREEMSKRYHHLYEWLKENC